MKLQDAKCGTRWNEETCSRPRNRAVSALIHACDARDMQENSQTWFRSWRKFSSPSKLSSTPNPRLSMLSPATSKKAASISKTVQERDRVLTRARKAIDTHTTARSRIQALEGELTAKSRAIDTLTTDLLRPTSAYKDSQLHGRELEDAQTTTPPADAAALQSQINVLSSDLRLRVEELEHECTYIQVLAREGEDQRASAQNHALDLEAQRDRATGSAKDANDALVKAQARIHALDDELYMSSQSQTVSAVTSNFSRLEFQIESLMTDLWDALAVRKDFKHGAIRWNPISVIMLDSVTLVGVNAGATVPVGVARSLEFIEQV
ncbi:hypothetical protein BDN70DRAFT_889110 [Pholiota conissans]|uniref:Uncharacterized protein n=1 Tax=Pholiota conissans TaxID=109636 RepID=A0A9P5YI98_9AGAR|nr:hypothetical protein BDN70DRAFT_889110 [Pholiota conissans]